MRRVCVRSDGVDSNWVVRERPLANARCWLMTRLRRDLLREGILNEGRVGPVRVDHASAGDVFDYMMARNERETYPYVHTWLLHANRAVASFDPE